MGTLQKCLFERCYSYPYRAGSDDYLNDPCYRRGRQYAREVVQDFIGTYQCACQTDDYFELVPHRVRDICGPPGPGRKRWADMKSVRLCDADNGLQPLKADVSRTMIEEFGIIWDAGYWCTDEIFRVLDPFLRRPFFWTKKITRLR